MTSSASSPGESAGIPVLAVLFIVIGVASVCVYIVVYMPLTGPGAPTLETRLIAYPILFALYLPAVYLVRRYRKRVRGGGYAILVVGFAVLMRGVILSGPVARNNDTWRYLWEGRVVLEGMNPYAAPPGDDVYDGLRQELEGADDPLYEGLLPALNHVRSVYGPIATGLFVVPHLLPFDRIWSCRLITTLFDLATAFVVMGLLRTLGRPTALALVYAWNPVCMNAYADRAHIDAPMVFFLALAAWLLCLKRPGWAGLAFGAAMLVKVSPIWLALPMIRLGRVRFTAALVVLCLLGTIPFAMAGEGALSGFREFTARWHNTDSIYGLLLLVLQPLKGLINPSAMARAIVMVAAVAYAVWRTIHGSIESGGQTQWLMKACSEIAAAGILLSPVVHPWYTAHLLVFLVFAPNPGMLLLTAATMCWFLKFWEPTAGSWPATLLKPLAGYSEPWRWVAYPPVYALLLREWRRRRTARRAIAEASG